MRLSRHYRKRFATYRGDRLLLYFTAALSFHMGVGSALWVAIQPAPNEPEAELASQPIDFIYLDAPSQDAPESARRAVVNAQAGGDRQALPTTAGSPADPSKQVKPTATSKSVTLKPPFLDAELVPASHAAPVVPEALPTDTKQVQPASAAKPLVAPPAAAIAPAVDPAPAPEPVIATEPATTAESNLDSEPSEPPLATTAPTFPSLAPVSELPVLAAEPTLPTLVPVAELPAIATESNSSYLPPAPPLPEVAVEDGQTQDSSMLSVPPTPEPISIPVPLPDVAIAPTAESNPVDVDSAEFEMSAPATDAAEIALNRSTEAPSSSAPLPSEINKAPDEVEELATPLGTGLDGIQNPNRSAIAPAGVDAQQDETWGAYINSLNQAVYDAWEDIDIDTSYHPKVRLVLNRQGELVDLTLAQASGSAIADQAALTAVRTAAPFEPLPEATTHTQLAVTLTFDYIVVDSPSAGAPSATPED
ncbi:TonB family protein [Leptolyngbya sp. AN02str]|uniref:TonB family protein n=1 Tax=Leptolyngbya sp. AN02str TaxID=3423363 RepID=UPI003D3212BE